MSPLALIASACSPVDVGLGGLGIWAAWWVAGRLPRRPRPAGELIDDDRATAMLDFVLVFPLFAMIVLIIVQLALLIHARLIVGYAAFAAARSAVVWLAEDPDQAQERAERAAQIGCLAISPAAASGLGSGGWGDGLSVSPLYLHVPSRDRLAHRIRRGGSKMAWSKGATFVRILPSTRPLGPHDPISAQVEHSFYLSVPYGDRIFRDGTFRGLPVRTIKDTFTLTNEGYVQSR